MVINIILEKRSLKVHKLHLKRVNCKRNFRSIKYGNHQTSIRVSAYDNNVFQRKTYVQYSQLDFSFKIKLVYLQLEVPTIDNFLILYKLLKFSYNIPIPKTIVK